jgi:hypothetical protein
MMEGVTDKIRAGRSDGMFSARDARETLALARSDGTITGPEYTAVETAMTDVRGDVARESGRLGGRSVSADEVTPEVCDRLARETRDPRRATLYRQAGESLRNLETVESELYRDINIFRFLFNT